MESLKEMLEERRKSRIEVRKRIVSENKTFEELKLNSNSKNNSIS